MSDVFFALAEPRRRSIIEILAAGGEMPATRIAKRFKVTPSAISQHLKILKEAGLVHMRKRAQQRLYHLDPAGIEELEKWAQQLADKWEKRFARLDKILESERKEKSHGK